MLSICHRVLDKDILDEEDDNILFKLHKRHINHPCSVWVRKSHKNYYWLWYVTYYLCREYTKRYEKVIKIQKDGLLDYLYTLPFGLQSGEFSDPPLCMPDIYKGNSVIDAYRFYYISEKSKFAKWKLGNVPEWYTK